MQEEHELNLNMSISYSLTQVKSNALCFYIRRYWACESVTSESHFCHNSILPRDILVVYYDLRCNKVTLFYFRCCFQSRSISICTKLIVRLKLNKMRSISSFELRKLNKMRFMSLFELRTLLHIFDTSSVNKQSP